MQSPLTSSPFFSVVQAANYLGLKRQTLDNYRWAGGGPRYRKHGGRVLYTKDELDRWSSDRQWENTAQPFRPNQIN
ncbi:helix-turn-helix domain-containing protein [Hirschia baltica]|uniref:Helix-turn-helix domain-containing protein n=1 Tax=Hirschia baltica (strain ATCC 49814 / DSM 5838 / IFAM 1418) TaxID=582402 RepID=C6XP95_HIRBI|nr:helix-turn-helix domain-containing protein [Hirschia baltica]ACT58381.1 hypothetical protein Hbal_0682 [Hirschia baltica ATCC 49814]